MIIKGVTHSEDALRIKKIGCDAVWVSNHGGRQLDSAPSAIDKLPCIRQAVGKQFPLIFDSGVRSGDDIVKALAMGANFVMLGRPILYSLAAGGESGLNSFVGSISDELSTVMAQLGLSAIGEIDKHCLVSST